MLKNNLKTLTFVNLIVIISVFCFLLFEKIFDKEEIVYVDNVKLFDNFQMTKDMKIIGERDFKLKKNIVDSLYLKLQEELSYVEKENTMRLFVSKKEELEQFNEMFAINETEKIWNRINLYVKSYSKENEYNMIFGSSSNMGVLYVNENSDITSKLTEYINEKYEGSK